MSIANWVKTQDEGLLPDKRRLWYKDETPIISSKRRARGTGSAAKDYELMFREVSYINSALSDQTDLSGASVLTCNTTPQRVFQGVTPGHKGFVLTSDERAQLIAKSPRSVEVIYPYLIGDEVLSGSSGTSRYVIDYGQRTILEARGFEAVFEYVKNHVLPDIERRAAEEHDDESARRAQLSRWWQHWRGRAEMIQAISILSRYLVCSRVTKRPIFVFVHRAIRPGDALQVFAFDDDYSFGIMQSDIHWQWFIAKCSKLKSDFRYTPESVFDTFPWPQSPSIAQIDAVAVAGREVRRVRVEALTNVNGGLRDVYRTLELPGKNPLKEAHAALNEAVLEAYGFTPKRDLLAQILGLNQDVAQRIETLQPVYAPGLPHGHKTLSQFITNDCLGRKNEEVVPRQ